MAAAKESWISDTVAARGNVFSSLVFAYIPTQSAGFVTWRTNTHLSSLQVSISFTRSIGQQKTSLYAFDTNCECPTFRGDPMPSNVTTELDDINLGLQVGLLFDFSNFLTQRST